MQSICTHSETVRGKFDAKSKPMIMIGYCGDSKGYLLANPEKLGKIEKHRDVIFAESIMHAKEKDKADNVNFVDEIEPSVPPIVPEDLLDVTAHQGEDDLDVGHEVVNVDMGNFNVPEPEIGNRGRPVRKRQAPLWLRDDYVVYLSVKSNDFEPISVNDALIAPDKDGWINAMKLEYESMIANKVWTLVDKPEGQNIVSCKWVFSLKRDPNGETRHKARLVARGFSQTYGVDYFDTFSPVARISTLRILIALACELDLLIEHFDVTTAFLHGNLDEKVYMMQPEGFEKKGY